MLLNLYFYRLKKGYTQNFIANELGIAQQTYSKWELGINNPRVDKLPILAKILGVPISYLFK